MTRVTLQISLAPSDYKHAIHLLHHQVKVFNGQVDEILMTYDIHKSKGHFAANWEENNDRMWTLLEDTAAKNNKIRLVKIDYSQQTNKTIAKTFFKTDSIPAKDWRGGPFYTYFFGIYAATHNLVLHIDSDLFFGGLSTTWISEAINLYESDSKILFVNPLAGPPTANGTLKGQNCRSYYDKPFYFRFDTMSTRIFLVDRRRLSGIPFTKIHTTKWREIIRALYKGNPPYTLPEQFITESMRKNGQIRVDFKGNEPGLWSLHPPYRTADFYVNLPQIIERIEKNDVPDAQKGFYDIVDELVDWTEAKVKFKKA